MSDPAARTPTPMPPQLAADLAADLDRAAELLAQAAYVVVLTGAGVSKESGIPTFRGEGGLWTTNGEPPMNGFQLFLEDSAGWWRQRLERRRAEQADPTSFARAVDEAQPNAAHHALAELERIGVVRHLITQNVDDLHRRAGQQEITEIHGNRHWMRCLDCGMRWPAREFPVEASALPPHCAQPGCDGVVKDDTVMFGEPIPAAALARCDAETRRADCLLVVGTSAVVMPAAGFPLLAWQRGVPLVEVNPEPTPLSEYAEVSCRGPAGELLPELAAALRLRLGASA
jgi:NAD-dependent deacetylase